MIDVHAIRHGYNLADLDRLARTAILAAQVKDMDSADKYDAAWHAIAAAVCAADERPAPSTLKYIGADAINACAHDQARHHGRTQEGQQRPRWMQYWELSSRPIGSPEAAVIEGMALWQIWPQLHPTDRRTLLTLVACDYDQDLAAAALGKSTAAFATALSTARKRFAVLWHEHETPQRRVVWGKADRRRGTRYTATHLAGIRQRRKEAAA